MLNIVFIFTFYLFIAILISIYKHFKTLKSNQAYHDEIIKNDDEQDLKLMIGYNYMSSLRRLSDLVKKLYDKEIDANTINYMENFIRDTKSFIYSPESLERTIYYENEYLYKQEIINLDILFYASERLCKCRFEMFNDKEDLNNILELEKNNYLKYLDKLSKKGKRIMRFKKDKNTYYKYIENMKIDYYNLVDNSKPFMLLVFLDYAVNALNQQN